MKEEQNFITLQDNYIIFVVESSENIFFKKYDLYQYYKDKVWENQIFESSTGRNQKQL